jgi:hypothetical protein
MSPHCSIAPADSPAHPIPSLVPACQLEVRKRDNGDVIYRDHLGSAVASVLAADYRQDGSAQAVVVSCEGEVGMLGGPQVAWRGRLGCSDLAG